jgi:hypothetical protein
MSTKIDEIIDLCFHLCGKKEVEVNFTSPEKDWTIGKPDTPITSDDVKDFINKLKKHARKMNQKYGFNWNPIPTVVFLSKENKVLVFDGWIR